MFPVWAWFLVSLVASVALAPKPPRPRSAALEDFEIPTAELDRPLPVVFGTKRITGPNVCWYGDFKSTRIKQRSLFSSQTVGFRYFMGLHIGICHGPVDELSKIEVGDKELWSGSVTSNEQIKITDKTELFGGDQREGGMAGTIDVMMGADTQAANGYLSATIDGPMPAFRGMFGLVYRTADVDLDVLGGEFPANLASGGYVGNSPYLKPWAITLTRIKAGWVDDVCWYEDKAEIPDAGMNPAHIVYQALTDPRFGMGAPTSTIDEDSFEDAADTLYDEGFGLNLLWNQSTLVDDFIQIVLDHIDGVLAFSPATNKYVLKLIRADYDEDDLEEFDESRIESMDSLDTQSWGETVNELTLTYTDPDTLKSVPLVVQDLANVRAQGAVVPEQLDFSGIHSHELIRTVAGRKLAQRATPLWRGRMIVDRNFWSHTLGDVFKLTWPPRDIEDLVVRVIKVNAGTLERGAIAVDFVEDIYALDGVEYTESQDAGTEPDPLPAPDVETGGATNVLSRTLSSPPSGPADGDRYFIPADPEPEGDWAGHAGQIAEWDEGLDEWFFIDVPAGVVIYDEGADGYFTSDGEGNTTTVTLGGGGTSTSLESEITADAPTGYWKCNEESGTTLADSSGNDFDLTLAGDYDLAYSPLVEAASSHIRFQANGRASAAGDLGLTPPVTGDWTIEAVFACESSTVTFFILALVSDTASEDEADNYQLRAEVSTGDMRTFWEYDGGTNQFSTSTVQVLRDRKYHAAFVKDGTAGTMAFHLNGVKLGTVNYGNEPTGGTDQLNIVLGNVVAGGDVIMGHVAFYDRKLSNARIAAHAQAAGVF